MFKLFKHQYKHRTCITYKINRHNKETDVSFYLKTGYKAVKENALKAEISNVQT